MDPSFKPFTGNFVVFDPKRSGVSLRVRPSSGSPRLPFKFTNVHRTVSCIGEHGKFFLIETDGDEGWVKGKLVYRSALIAPKNPKREHIKVRINPNPERKNFLEDDRKKPVEVARDQLVAVLGFEGEMVRVGFRTTTGSSATGWVKRENMHRS